MTPSLGYVHAQTGWRYIQAPLPPGLVYRTHNGETTSSTLFKGERNASSRWRWQTSHTAYCHVSGQLISFSYFIIIIVRFDFRLNPVQEKWKMLRKCKYVGLPLPSFIAENTLKEVDYAGKLLIIFGRYSFFFFFDFCFYFSTLDQSLEKWSWQ